MKYDSDRTVLARLVAKYGFEPSKTYGQNFLIDESVVDRIIEKSNIKNSDSVLEIGPGFGVLTGRLVANAKQVVSFEIEKKLSGYWDEQLKKFPNLKIIWGNALKTFPEFTKNFPAGYKVVANLPYQITSAAIRMLLETENPPEQMTLMVQKEVGERICAKAGEMSLLSVSVQYYAEPVFEFVVPSSAFWPPPKVDSAVITLKRKLEFPAAEDTKWFFSVVKQGFSNRRKLLIKNLSGIVENKKRQDLLGIFGKLSLLPTVRAQELSVPVWRELALEIKNLKK